MKHPFKLIPPSRQKTLFWPMLGITFVLMAAFGITGAPVTTSAARYRVVSFELAGSVPRAEEILASWDSAARQRAAFGLGLDFLFIPVYALTIALGCTMAADSLRRRGWPLSLLGGYLAWGVWVAGFLDILENIALVIILFGQVAAPWPQIAALCAICKFSLLFLALVYVLYGTVTALANPQKSAS